MTIALFGESCTGKSTLAKLLSERLNAAIYSGKDYLRLAKTEREAAEKFSLLLRDPAQNTLFVISEKEQMKLLPEDCIRILVTAELETIQSRFSQRMGGKLPPPVAAMIERKHGIFDDEPCDVRIVSEQSSPGEAAEKALQYCTAHRQVEQDGKERTGGVR